MSIHDEREIEIIISTEEPYPLSATIEDTIKLMPFRFYYRANAKVIGHNTHYDNIFYRSLKNDESVVRSDVGIVNTFGCSLSTMPNLRHLELEQRLDEKLTEVQNGLSFNEPNLEQSAVELLHAALKEYVEWANENLDKFNGEPFVEGSFAKTIEKFAGNTHTQIEARDIGEEDFNSIHLSIQVIDSDTKEELFRTSNNRYFCVRRARVTVSSK